MTAAARSLDLIHEQVEIGYGGHRAVRRRAEKVERPHAVGAQLSLTSTKRGGNGVAIGHDTDGLMVHTPGYHGAHRWRENGVRPHDVRSGMHTVPPPSAAAPRRFPPP